MAFARLGSLKRFSDDLDACCRTATCNAEVRQIGQSPRSSTILEQNETRRHTVAFAQEAFARIRETLLADAPLESARFLLAHAIRSPQNRWRLLPYTTLAPTASEYLDRTSSSIELSPAFVGRVLQQGRSAGSAIIMVHSHPFPGLTGPSSVDTEGESVLVPVIQQRIPGVAHGRIIIGPQSTHSAVFLPQEPPIPADVIEVGASIVHWPEFEAEGHAADDSGQYDRQVRAFGSHGQRYLAALRIGIVGLGGTGSVVAQQLAHLGVTDFVLIDPDAIETTNLNRVVGASPNQVGVPKVLVAEQMIRRINPTAKTDALREDIRDASTVRRLLDVDFFFCCTDSQGSRAVLNQFAYQYLVPGIDLGVVIDAREGRVSHISARVQMLAPGLACLVCGELLDSEEVRRDLLSDEARKNDQYILGNAIPQPSVISINSLAASNAVTMFLGAVVGMPVPSRHQLLRLQVGTTADVHVTQNPACYVCSPLGAAGRGDTWPAPGRLRPEQSV
jgi:hypothetical protein